MKQANIRCRLLRLRLQSSSQEFGEGLAHEIELCSVQVAIQMFKETTEVSPYCSSGLSVRIESDLSPRLSSRN